MNLPFLSSHRCRCGKLLLKGLFFSGSIEIKCKKCKKTNKIGNIKLTNDKEHYLLIVDQNGLIKNASDSAELILGYTIDELVGKHFTKINPTLPKEFSKKTIGPESILSEDNYFKIDTFHQNKKGEKIPVLVLLKLYKPTEEEQYVLVSAYVKKEEGQKGTPSKKELNLSKKSCDYYFDLDKNGNIEYMSPAIKDFFKFFPEAVVGNDYFAIMPIEERSVSKETFKYFLKNEEPFRAEDTACLSTNGKTIRSELFFTPKYDDLGKFTGYRVLAWATDMS